jgi:hypothetical protein
LLSRCPAPKRIRAIADSTSIKSPPAAAIVR